MAKPPVSSALTLPIEGTEEVQIFRTWLRPPPTSTMPWVALLLKQRSHNVRELFPDSLSKDPAYVWAAELCSPLTRDDDVLVRAGETVAGSPGDIVYMFEPKVLAGVFADSFSRHFPLVFRSPGKTGVFSKRFKTTVQARQWEVRRRPVPQQPIATGLLLMPSAAIEVPAELREEVKEEDKIDV